MEEFAPKVFDIDQGLFDRTKKKHRYPYDVDVRVPSAPKGRNKWLYWGSQRSIEKAKKEIDKYVKTSLGFDAEARIVEAKTGKVLEVIK